MDNLNLYFKNVVIRSACTDPDALFFYLLDEGKWQVKKLTNDEGEYEILFEPITD